MHIVVLITAKDTKEAEKISRVLVSKKLIACANIVRDIHSFFWWKGKVERAKEVLLILKTKRSLFKKIEKTVKSLHSYDVPEIIALPIIEGSKNYLGWMNASLR